MLYSYLLSQQAYSIAPEFPFPDNLQASSPTPTDLPLL